MVVYIFNAKIQKMATLQLVQNKAKSEFLAVSCKRDAMKSKLEINHDPKLKAAEIRSMHMRYSIHASSRTKKDKILIHTTLWFCRYITF